MQGILQVAVILSHFPLGVKKRQAYDVLMSSASLTSQYEINTVFISIPLLQGSVTLAAKFIRNPPETMYSTQTNEILVLNVLKAKGLCQKKFNKRFNGMSQFIRNRIHVACLRAF